MDFLEYLNRKYEKTPEVENTGSIKWTETQSIGSKITSGVKKVGTNIADYFKSLKNVKPMDFVKEIPNQLSVQIGQPSMRAYGGFANWLLGGKGFKPEGQFQQDLYGTDKPITFTSVGEEVVGQGPVRSKYVAPAVGAFFAVADITPAGKPLKEGAKEIRPLLSQLVRLADEAEIQTTLRPLGLSDDAARELSQSIRLINTESNMGMGARSREIQNIVDDVLKRANAIPEGAGKSVVQVVNPRTGENVFYEVDPATLKVLSEDLIDGTGRGIAGREIDGNIYHLTAKTPSEMLERAGWRNGGQKTLDDIVEMITPKKRVPVRTEDGRFAGSFIDDTPAFKLASEVRASQEAEALTRRSIDNMGEFDMSIAEAKSAFRNMFDEKEMSFMFQKELRDGREMGNFSNKGFKPLVQLVEREGKVQSSTLHHEAFHAYFNTFIPQAQRQEILARIKNSPSTALSRGVKAFEGYRGADVRAEEWLADDFARYVREVSAGKKPTSVFADVWRKILTHIRQMIRKANHVDKLYQDILEKRRTGFVDSKSRVYKAKEGDGVSPERKKLLNEAKKYKSAEEFGLQLIKQLGFPNSTSPGAKTIKIIVNPKMRYWSANEVDRSLEALQKESMGAANSIKNATERSVIEQRTAYRDAVTNAYNWIKDNRDLLNDRSQLTDIWNEANSVERAKIALYEENVPSSKTEKEYDSILTQLAGAEKGERVGVTGPDGNFAGYRAKSSTFPEWVPEDLRSRELFDKYMDGRTGSLDDFKKTYKDGSRLARLDNEIRNRLFTETGEDLRLVPDEFGYIDELARQYRNEVEPITGESLRTGDTPLDPSVKTQTQGQQTGSQMPQSVSTGDSLPQVYPTKAKEAIVDIAQRQKEPVKQTVARFEGLRKVKTNILEYVQNTDERIRQIIESGDYAVTDASNIYQKATLASGRMGSRIEKMKDEVKAVLEDIRDTAKSIGREYDDLKGEVDDYLIARHAPERNAAIGEGAAGMTTAEAEAIIRKIESGPNGVEVARIADKVQKMNENTLDILLKSQVISEDLHALLRERYKFHVPLYRVQETDMDFGGALTGKGFDVRSTGIKRAKGSDKEIDDVIGNIMYNYEQAIIRSEKNIVDLATAKFVDDNKLKKGDIMYRTQLPMMPVGVATHKGQVFHEVMDKVNELVTKYGGTHERKLRSGQAFGYYQPSTNKIVTRFGTSKDTLIHEFGHMLDTHFGMRESDFFTKDISDELRAIADLRDSADPLVVAQRTKSRERYVRSGPEKIAEFISTYFSDMDTARNVAPKATAKFTKFLEDKPELRELSDVMKSRARSEEIMQETLFAQQKFTNDPSILTFRENGKASYIKIADKNLAVAIRGVGREKLGGILNAVRAFTNFYSGLHTRFNPDFALPNKIRDLQETMTYLASQKDLKASSVAKVAYKDPKSVKDVIAALRGQDTEGARLYNEMKEQGGTTGGMGLSTREQTGLDMAKMDKLMNSKTRRTTEKLIEYVDNWNTIFEDSTRLSVYRQAREQGLSKERAAFLAKEASINFNRMGKGGPVINALWMFSNASIQGSTKMLRALKNPKVLAGVVTTVGVSVAVVNEWNDSVDPEWRSKVPKWDRMNSLPVVLPSEEDGKFNYFAIPVSWGIKPIKVMADYATDAMSGHAKNAKEMIEGLFTSIIEGYNPLGGTDALSAIFPTFLDTPSEIARNQSWTGAKITPTNYNNAPDDTLYFSSLPETQVGRTAISLSELLAKGGIEVSPANIKYAYEQYVGGAGRFVTRLFNTVSGAISGDPAPLDEYPFVSRFYRERSGDELEYTKSTETEGLDTLMDEDARAKKKLNVEASRLKDEIMALPTSEEKKARLKEISTQNPELAEKVLDYIEDDKAGLTPQESQLKNATVAVRAEYIRKELEKLGTPEEKKAYLKELKTKKILTASVMDELGL